jgi:hypothetical protein
LSRVDIAADLKSLSVATRANLDAHRTKLSPPAWPPWDRALVLSGSMAESAARRARIIKDQGRSTVRADLERLADLIEQGG